MDNYNLVHLHGTRKHIIAADVTVELVPVRDGYVTDSNPSNGLAGGEAGRPEVNQADALGQYQLGLRKEGACLQAALLPEALTRAPPAPTLGAILQAPGGGGYSRMLPSRSERSVQCARSLGLAEGYTFFINRSRIQPTNG